MRGSGVPPHFVRRDQRKRTSCRKRAWYGALPFSRASHESSVATTKAAAAAAEAFPPASDRQAAASASFMSDSADRKFTIARLQASDWRRPPPSVVYSLQRTLRKRCASG
ncbi:hypothetical protein MRX96_036108 [Rhipicephalus microplus]